MNSLRCFLLTFLLYISYSQLNAQVKEWDVRLANGKELSSITPVSVSTDSLMFHSERQIPATVEISQIKEVTYRVGPSKAGKSLAIGLLSGGAVGFVAGLIADGTSSVDQYGNQHSTDYKVALPVAGGIVGGIAGYAAGASSGKRSLDLSSMTVDEKRVAMGDLMSPGSAQPPAKVATQTPQRDVVYLNNGSIIRGTILEMIPDSTLRIITADSSLFVFRMSEVERVTKESINAPPPSPSRVAEQKRQRNETNETQYPGRVRFGLNLGASFPMGVFGSITEEGSGLAKGGFTFGGELDYQFDNLASYLTSVSVAFNSFDDGAVESATGLSVDAGSWVTIWPMTGLRLSPRLGGNTSIYVQGQVGLLIGSSPELTVSSGNVRATQPSATATAIAFSVGGGFLAADKVQIGVRYFYAEPEYEATASSGSQSGTSKFKQPTGVLLLTLGVML